MSDYSWSDDPLFEARFTRDLSAQVAHTPPQVPDHHGPETEDLLFDPDLVADDCGPMPWESQRHTQWSSLLETRCGLEFIRTNIHTQPEVGICRYPWWHRGEHGMEIPELYREWDEIATQIAEQRRAHG